VLELRSIPDPEPAEGTVIVRMKAIGLNFADVYRRKGNYHLAGKPPYILGYEGAGVIERIGSGVTGLSPGDRVAFADMPFANAAKIL
jgi:NADPH2:quinone reductase